MDRWAHDRGHQVDTMRQQRMIKSTLYLPKKVTDVMDDIITNAHYPSRTAIIRRAISRLLKEDFPDYVRKYDDEPGN